MSESSFGVFEYGCCARHSGVLPPVVWFSLLLSLLPTTTTTTTARCPGAPLLCCSFAPALCRPRNMCFLLSCALARVLWAFSRLARLRSIWCLAPLLPRVSVACRPARRSCAFPTGSLSVWSCAHARGLCRCLLCASLSVPVMCALWLFFVGLSRCGCCALWLVVCVAAFFRCCFCLSCGVAAASCLLSLLSL